MSLTQVNKAGLDEIALDHVFTIGASGSSAYTFQGEGLNGTVNNPTLYLTRGKTYRFENGSGGHPIRIQSTSGASGTAYNTGVTNNAGGGTVIVEVQHDAPDVLYYQCTSHAAMNGILYITGALADGGVTTAKIAADAVTGAKIADDAINSEHYTDGSIDTAHIADAQITTTKIADDQITTAKINDGAVTTAKIANSAITSAKIANNNVGSQHIANGEVGTTELADDAVTSAKIASNSVTNDSIANDSIHGDKIQTQTISLAKLVHGTSSQDGKFLRANNGADPTFETITGTTINNNNAGRVITGSGTANTLEGNTKFTFSADLVKAEKRMVIGNGTEFQIPSRSGTSSYTPQLQVTGGWSNPTHGGTLALNGRDDYPLLWMNSGASYQDNSGAGYINFSIKDGAGNYCNTASIRSLVDGTPGNNDSPGDLTFMTTPDGTCTTVARMTINHAGYVTKPYQPMFQARNSTGNHITINQGVIPFQYVINNVGSHYNNSNYRFTAPVAGVYLFYIGWFITSSSNHRVNLRINGSDFTTPYIHGNSSSYGGHIPSSSGSQFVKLSANDYVEAYTSATFYPYGTHLGWGGYLLG